MLKESRFLRALNRQPVDKTPVWIMRQAGRYLPEYRATRKRAGDFLTLCKTPELACEVTLQPLARYPLDAAIVFSDILTIPDAMGLGLSLVEGVGPRFANPIRTSADIFRLGIPDPDIDLSYVGNAIRLIKRELNNKVPLIGFCGSPWTVATYMIEGKSNHDFTLVKRMLYDQPKLFHQLLELLAESSLRYLLAQIEAGADTVMIFDTWGGVLSTPAYLEFSLRYLKQIVTDIDDVVPTIVFTKGGGQWLESIANTGCSAVGLDWTVDVAKAKNQIGDRVALQGNMDPAVLRSHPMTIVNEANAIVEAFGAHPGHVFNLGHGITPDIDPDNVAVLIDAVHSRSATILCNSSI